MLENFSKRTKLIFSGIIASLFVFIILLSLSSPNKSVEAPASTQFYSDAPCYILDGEKIYSKIDPYQFLSLRKNLTQYARQFVKGEDPTVDYELISDVAQDNNTLEFSLKSLNTPKHEIIVMLKTLPNSRINISIKDKSSGSAGYDDSLEANSKRNAFVSTLPVTLPGFSVEYELSVERFRITLTTKSAQNRDESLSFVAEQSGLGSLDENDYSLIAPGYLDDFSGVGENQETDGDY